MKIILFALILFKTFDSFSQISSLEQKTYDLLNAYKLKFNGDTTVLAEEFSNESREHSKLMAEKRDIFHAETNFLGEIVQKTNKYECNEEVYKCTEDEIAEKILRNFLNSPPHKENLEHKWRLVGVGIVIDDRGYVWVTIRFF
jgi:uncharacterized protein YkwD